MKTILALLLAVLVLGSCQSQEKQSLSALESQEALLYSDTTGEVDVAEGLKMIELYIQYVDSVPEDSLHSPNYLFKGGEVAMGIGEYWRSIQLFSRLQNEYPNYDRAPDALFYQGFIFENYLGLVDYAKKSYTKYLLNYPKGEHAQDIRNIMAVMDQPIEKVVEGWEKKINTEENE